MKKLILIGALFITVVSITGCSNENNKDPLLELCNNVYETIDDYESGTINKNEFIDEIQGLSKDCTDSDELICAEISTFENLSETTTDELIDAHITQLKNYCQMVEDKS